MHHSIQHNPESALNAVFQCTYDYIDNSADKKHQQMTISLVPADVERDATLLYEWMNLDHVAQFWQQAWPKERIRGYLDKQVHSYHEVYFLYINSKAVAYTELYPVEKDPLTECCQHHDSDRGWHVLVGPKPLIGSGINILLGKFVLDYLFSHTQAINVFCEPDYRNSRMISFVSKLGHRSQGLIQLGDKQAELMCCCRHDYEKIDLQTPTFTPGNNGYTL